MNCATNQSISFREALDLMRIHEGVSVTIESDVKPGSGLGGSSAFAVGLIKALQRFSCRHVGRQNFWQSIPESYAQLACELEIERRFTHREAGSIYHGIRWAQAFRLQGR